MLIKGYGIVNKKDTLVFITPNYKFQWSNNKYGYEDVDELNNYTNFCLIGNISNNSIEHIYFGAYYLLRPYQGPVRTFCLSDNGIIVYDFDMGEINSILEIDTIDFKPKHKH